MVSDCPQVCIHGTPMDVINEPKGAFGVGEQYYSFGSRWVYIDDL